MAAFLEIARTAVAAYARFLHDDDCEDNTDHRAFVKTCNPLTPMAL